LGGDVPSAIGRIKALRRWRVYARDLSDACRVSAMARSWQNRNGFQPPLMGSIAGHEAGTDHRPSYPRPNHPDIPGSRLRKRCAILIDRANSSILLPSAPQKPGRPQDRQVSPPKMGLPTSPRQLANIHSIVVIESFAIFWQFRFALRRFSRRRNFGSRNVRRHSRQTPQSAQHAPSLFRFHIDRPHRKRPDSAFHGFFEFEYWYVLTRMFEDQFADRFMDRIA
jgi:hypothetical protein